MLGDYRRRARFFLSKTGQTCFHFGTKSEEEAAGYPASSMLPRLGQGGVNIIPPPFNMGGPPSCCLQLTDAAWPTPTGTCRIGNGTSERSRRPIKTHQVGDFVELAPASHQVLFSEFDAHRIDHRK